MAKNLSVLAEAKGDDPKIRMQGVWMAGGLNCQRHHPLAAAGACMIIQRRSVDTLGLAICRAQKPVVQLRIMWHQRMLADQLQRSSQCTVGLFH